MKRNDDGSTKKTDADRGRRVRVLQVDDHTMFREGLAGMLSSAYGDEVEVVGKTKIGKEAVVLARKKNPDVIIMQVDGTLKKAKDILNQTRKSSPSPPKVIILTMFEDPRMVRQIMELGATAYIYKSVSVEKLFAVLRVTARDAKGEHVVVAMPQRALELSEDGLGKDGAGGVLSRRELESLLLAARGMSNRQISS